MKFTDDIEEDNREIIDLDYGVHENVNQDLKAAMHVYQRDDEMRYMTPGLTHIISESRSSLVNLRWSQYLKIVAEE